MLNHLEIMKRKIIIVLGPTGSGKSKIAITLAKRFNGFLISADSRQIYKKMDIGTNKDNGEYRQGKYFVGKVEECLVNLINPDEQYSLENWLKDARKIITEHPKQLPVIVGGTGLYISALVNNFELPGNFDKKLRTKLEKQAAEKGLAYLIKKMKELDPGIEHKIDLNNPRRVVRAMEILLQTKKPLNRSAGEIEYEFLQLGLKLTREELYEKINQRADQMITYGLIEEVKKLVNEGYDCRLPAMTGIGYRQVCQFLNKEITGQQAIELIKRDTRRYAKRQMTWFKRDKRIVWIEKPEEAKALVNQFLIDDKV